jgi:predicted  nucleic acid-binding Zn-ribbon protein
MANRNRKKSKKTGNSTSPKNQPGQPAAEPPRDAPSPQQEEASTERSTGILSSAKKRVTGWGKEPEMASSGPKDAVRKADLAPLKDRVNDLQRRLDSASGQLEAIPDLREDIDRLVTDISGVRGDLLKLTELRAEIAGLPTLMDQVVNLREITTEHTADVDSSIDELQTRLDGMSALTAHRSLMEVAQEAIDERVETIRADLGSRGERAREKLEQLLGWLNDDLDAYNETLATMPAGGAKVLQQRIDALQEQLAAADAQLDETRKAWSTTKTALEDRERENHLLRTQDNRVLLEKVLEKEQEVNRRRAELEQAETLRADNAILNRKLAALQNQERDVEREAVDGAELANLRGQLEEARAENTDQQRRLNQAQGEIRRGKRAITDEQKRSTELREQLQEIQHEIDQAEDRVRQIEDLQGNVKQLMSVSDDAHQKIDRLQVELTGLQDQHHEDVDALRHAEQRVREAKDEARKDLEQESRTRFDAKVADMRTELELGFAQDTANLTERIKVQERQITLFEAKLTTAEGTIEDLEAQIDKMKQDESARHQALADKLRQEEDAWRRKMDEKRSSELDEIRAEKSALSVDVIQLQKERAALDEHLPTLREEHRTLNLEMVGLTARKEELEGQVELLQQREEQLRHIDLPREERLTDLHKVQLEAVPTATGDDEELTWLEAVSTGIEQAGFIFPPRLLRAFHTSLKCADISPITVLAGISGTGKSELPRLYADVGGLRFLNLAIQPNWDSPDDLFGFFNYTDGRYRATPLSRVLYQISGTQPAVGLKDQMVLVLLDEMNIARVEYYFSELLSRLETRRDLQASDEAAHRGSIPIDAGAGEPDEVLFLDHNLLFTGTMNEDESTLTLSDKVKDRAQMLTFPSPRRFHDRTIRKVTPRAEALSRASWKRWLEMRRALDGDQQLTIERDAEGFNQALQHVGQAIGHRVFQAISMYAVRYPRIEDDQVAFEHARADIYAQKLIPKLVGIECRSRQGEKCLDMIEALLPGELGAAFKQSRDQDYFTWQGSRELFDSEAVARATNDPDAGDEHIDAPEVLDVPTGVTAEQAGEDGADPPDPDPQDGSPDQVPTLDPDGDERNEDPQA